MEHHKIKCNDCNVEITEYYDEHYKGRRGKCPKCETDFPLD